MRNLFALFLVLASAATSFAGPTSSGGGANICYLPSGPELLDLVIDNKVISRNSRQPGIEAPEVQRGQFTSFNPVQGLLKRRIDKILEPFTNKYYKLHIYRQFKFNLDKTIFFAVPAKFDTDLAAHYASLETCNASNTRAVISFISGYKFISAPLWNELDLDTQAYAIIHEAWRFVQLMTNDAITNEDLQNLTYATIYNKDFYKSERLLKIFSDVEFDQRDGRIPYCQLKEQAQKESNHTVSENAILPLTLGCENALLVESSHINNALAVINDESLRQDPLISISVAQKLRDFYYPILTKNIFDETKIKNFDGLLNYIQYDLDTFNVRYKYDQIFAAEVNLAHKNLLKQPYIKK